MDASRSEFDFTGDTERRLIQNQLDSFWQDGGSFADLLALHQKRRRIRRELERVSRAEYRQNDSPIAQVAIVALLLLVSILLATLVA